MTLSYACIAPHGGELIPQLAHGRMAERFRKTRGGIRELARSVARYKPDTIVVASPHNLRLFERIGIIISENSSGTLGSSPRHIVRLRAKCDVSLGMGILRRAINRRLPVVGANYGTSEGSTSNLPMDWGTLVPLWFMLKEKKVRSRIVIVTPSREIPLGRNIEFGRVLGSVLEDKKHRYVFVASADQAHAHSKSGPYGFSPAASQYDNLVVNALKRDKLDLVMKVDPRLIEDAKPDSLWQMAMLAGILKEVRMRSHLVSYDVPTYYGMVCAGFDRLE